MNTRGIGRIGRWAAASAALAAVCSMLVGCSLFENQPPGSVKAAVEGAAESIREVDGVTFVQSNLVTDGKEADDSMPDAWTATFVIKVEPNLADLNHVTSVVEREVATANSTLSTMGTVYLPADSVGPHAGIEFAASRHLPVAKRLASAELTAATQSLRSIDGVTDVTVSTDGRPVEVLVESPSEWPRVAATLRALPGFGEGALAYATVATSYYIGLTLDAISPTPALVDVLSSLASGPAVEQFAFNDIPPFGPIESHGGRPLVRIVVSADAAAEAAWGKGTRVEAGAQEVKTAKAEGARIVELLTQLDDGDTQTEGVPRASFDVVIFADAMPIPYLGFVGLPLGSAEPDDFVPPPTESADGSTYVETPPDPDVQLDPDAAAARLQSDQLLIEKLLNDAGDIAGIRGPAQVAIAACSSGVGEQISGSVMIPIFEIADSADEAFDAISASWVAGGYSATDRAMGTDVYSLLDPHDDGAAYGDLELLSIHGKATGISINVQSECIVAT